MDLSLDTWVKVSSLVGSTFIGVVALRKYAYVPLSKWVGLVNARTVVIAELKDSVESIAVETACIGELVHDMKNIRATNKRIEDRQVMEQQIQQCVMDNDGKAYFQMNLLGEMDMVSPSFCKLVGRAESELLGNNWLNCVSYKMRGEVMQQARLAREENRVFRCDVDFYASSGTLVRTIMRTYPIPRNVPVHNVMTYFGIVNLKE